jgi:branched-chain amino acid transport system substrate-binding protein
MYWHPNFPFVSAAAGLANAELAANYEAATGKQWNQAVGASASLFDMATALARQARDPKDREAMAKAMTTLKADTAVGHIDFSTGPVANCAISHLAGGQWNKSSDGPWPFKLDIVSNADFPQVPLTAELTPYKIGG